MTKQETKEHIEYLLDKGCCRKVMLKWFKNDLDDPKFFKKCNIDIGNTTMQDVEIVLQEMIKNKEVYVDMLDFRGGDSGWLRAAIYCSDNFDPDAPTMFQQMTQEQYMAGVAEIGKSVGFTVHG